MESRHLGGSLGQRASRPLKNWDGVSPVAVGRSPCDRRPPAATHPRLCGEWQSNRFAIGTTRSSFAGRAPKAEHWLSAWPSASKNAAATGMVRERCMLPLTFHTQWLVKGSCSSNKPFTRDRFAFDDERLGDSRKPFSHRACGRQLLWKCSAMCEAIHQLGYAHGARTAKLLRTSQRPSQCSTLATGNTSTLATFPAIATAGICQWCASGELFRTRCEKLEIQPRRVLAVSGRNGRDARCPRATDKPLS